MEFKTTDLDTKIKEITGVGVVGHDRTLREQIVMDEEKFGIEPIDLDLIEDDELNIHVNYLEYLHSKEG